MSNQWEPSSSGSNATTLTASQLKALAATGVELVAAPGSGKVLVPLGLFMEVKFGTTAFTDPSSSDITIVTSDTTGVSNTVWEFPAGGGLLPPTPGAAIWTQPNDVYWYTGTPPINSPFTPSAPLSNAPIGIVNFGGNLAAGDGTARFVVYYAVANLL